MLNRIFTISMQITCCALLWTVALANSHAEAPNFVIIMADELTYTDAGCYGNDEVNTQTSINWPPKACALPTPTPPWPNVLLSASCSTLVYTLYEMVPTRNARKFTTA